MSGTALKVAALLALRGAECAWRPHSANALYSYLAGEWRLDKSFSYVRGGVSGTFTGTASFNALSCGDNMPRLSYFEEGSAVLTRPGDRPMTLAATRRLLWEFHSADRVVVSFDEATEPRDPPAILANARFFHTIKLSDACVPPPFEHPCGPDVYTGRLSLDASNAFMMRWAVQGPRKSGTQLYRYKRLGTLGHCEGNGEQAREAP